MVARGHHHSFSSPTRGPKGGFLDVQLANGFFDGGSYFLSSSSSSQHNYLGGSSTATQVVPPTSAITPLRLPSRDESTRVQLQRQRIKEQHRAHLVSDKIPGFKTSAAFLSSLRTNLRLHASPPPSPMSTPPSMRGSATSLPPPSPLSGAVDLAVEDADSSAPVDPLEGVPELQSYLAKNDVEKVAALKLVADSVAQMRQTANRSLIFHPLNIAILVAVLSLVARYMYDARHDLSIVGTTCAGILMGFLAVCRFLTQNYLSAAEGINWEWLGDADVLVTKFGDEVIGTVVIDWVSGESRQRRKKAWRGEILAWTVRLRYRHKGVGTALLEDAVKEAKKKGAESIEFADEHANSKRVLIQLYNSGFDKREAKAKELLQDLLESSPSRGKRK